MFQVVQGLERTSLGAPGAFTQLIYIQKVSSLVVEHLGNIWNMRPPGGHQGHKHKAGYEQALDRQLKEAISTITQEIEIEKQMVRFGTQKTIAL